MRFLREELIPLIDSSYRTVPGDRGLMGHSFGGLFCAYVLTHEPGLFQKYSMGDPSLSWDNEAPFRWESEYAAMHTELRARVYVYLSAEGASIRRFWETLKARHYAGLDLIGLTVVPDEVHTSVILGSLEHALRKLYARRAVPLPIETMRRYIGEWRVGDEPAWTIRLSGERLVVDIPAYSNGPLEGRTAERRELLAENDSSFFSELGDLSISFTINPKERSASEMNVSFPRFGYAAVLRRLPPAPGASAVREQR